MVHSYNYIYVWGFFFGKGLGEMDLVRHLLKSGSLVKCCYFFNKERRGKY